MGVLHIFNKYKRKKLGKLGLSLIEVLVVMAITGATLVALLNLATRDVQVARSNEQQDAGNYLSVSQLEGFDAIRTASAGCLNALYTNYASGINTYYICQTNAFSSTGISPVGACTNTSAPTTWNIYPIGNNSALVYFDTNANDCTNAAPSNITAQDAQTIFKERLQVTGTSFDASKNATTIDLVSQVQWVGLNNTNSMINLQEEYEY